MIQKNMKNCARIKKVQKFNDFKSQNKRFILYISHKLRKCITAFIVTLCHFQLIILINIIYHMEHIYHMEYNLFNFTSRVATLSTSNLEKAPFNFIDM